MKDREFLKQRYKYVGEWIKLYSEFPESSFYEILVQNNEGEYTFKNEFSQFNTVKEF